MPDTAEHVYRGSRTMSADADIVLNTAADPTRLAACLPAPVRVVEAEAETVDVTWTPDGEVQLTTAARSPAGGRDGPRLGWAWTTCLPSGEPVNAPGATCPVSPPAAPMDIPTRPTSAVTPTGPVPPAG